MDTPQVDDPRPDIGLETPVVEGGTREIHRSLGNFPFTQTRKRNRTCHKLVRGDHAGSRQSTAGIKEKLVTAGESNAKFCRVPHCARNREGPKKPALQHTQQSRR